MNYGGHTDRWNVDYGYQTDGGWDMDHGGCSDGWYNMDQGMHTDL